MHRFGRNPHTAVLLAAALVLGAAASRPGLAQVPESPDSGATLGRVPRSSRFT